MPWPKGKPRKTQPAVTREPVHEPVRAVPKANGAVDMSQWDDFEYVDQDSNDRLKVPAEAIPDGMDYQWVTHSVRGMPFPQHRARFEMTGWRPVPSERHDGMFMPRGHIGEITIEDCVLMERPMEFSNRARDRDKRAARAQVATKEAQMYGGDIEGISSAFDTRHKTVRNTVNKTYEPMDIPQK